MRIALLTPVFAPAVGGMERFAEDLARWLVVENHEVVVLTKTPQGPDPIAMPFEVVRLHSWSDAGGHLRQADVVHINGLSLRASLAATRVGKAAVVTHAAHQAICPVGIASGPYGAGCTASGSSPGPCANCFRRGPEAWLNVRVQRLAAHRAATNVCISEYLERRLGLPRSTTIYNPVSAEAFADVPTERSDDQILFVGRLAQEKGPGLLLRALVDVPAARLTLAGDGPQRAELEALTRELGLQPRVDFQGSLSRSLVLAALRQATVACVPTTCEEAFGYAAAEAMAVGTPVVATPSGALPELLDDERGLLADSITPTALAAALRVALADRRDSSRRAERAARFARARFHIDATGPAYVQVYEEARS